MAQNKPAVVFVTQPWCGACKRLKYTIKSQIDSFDLFNSFLMVAVEGDENLLWQFGDEKAKYVPRTYFLDIDGKMHDVKGPKEKYARFYSTGKDVAESLQQLDLFTSKVITWDKKEKEL